MPCTTLNIAVLTPMPSARHRTAIDEKARLRINVRTAYRKSWRRMSMGSGSWALGLLGGDKESYAPKRVTSNFIVRERHSPDAETGHRAATGQTIHNSNGPVAQEPKSPR